MIISKATVTRRRTRRIERVLLIYDRKVCLNTRTVSGEWPIIAKMGRGRVDFDRGISRLASYARIYGHANPTADEVWLSWRVGLWVSSLRLKFRAGKLSAGQIAEAESIGVRLQPPYRDPKPKPPSRAERTERDMLKRLSKLEPFYRENGHINVKQHDGVNDWPGAGRWISQLRCRYRRGSLPKAVVIAAESMNLKWNLYRRQR